MVVRLSAFFLSLAVLLSGCTLWTGPGFYTRADSVQPFADLRPGGSTCT